MTDFIVKDSGKRQEFAGGMVRDTTDGKTEYIRVFEGPMLERWAEHLTKSAAKYPDRENGEANWTLAAGDEELRRFKASAVRHFVQWLYGETDEDHAAAVLFNINGAEYVREKMASSSPDVAPRGCDGHCFCKASQSEVIFHPERVDLVAGEKATGGRCALYTCKRSLKGIYPWKAWDGNDYVETCSAEHAKEVGS